MWRERERWKTQRKEYESNLHLIRMPGRPNREMERISIQRDKGWLFKKIAEDNIS